jgi:hypothetical protein
VTLTLFRHIGSNPKYRLGISFTIPGTVVQGSLFPTLGHVVLLSHTILPGDTVLDSLALTGRSTICQIFNKQLQTSLNRIFFSYSDIVYICDIVNRSPYCHKKITCAQKSKAAGFSHVAFIKLQTQTALS